MIYPANFESKIGFDAIRREVESHCVSVMGSRQCHDMYFSTNRDEVSSRLMETAEFLSILEQNKEFPLDHYYDLRGPLHAIATPGTFLSEERLHDLRRQLGTINEITRFFHATGEPPYPHLRILIGDVQPHPEIIAAIDQALDKFGNVKDNASPALSELRATIQRVTGSINGTLRRIIAQGRKDGFLEADVQPSMRDGRLVLPVAPMHKRKLHGIVHDESASGKTVFIEPEEIVEANNRIRETEAEIAREIIRILTEITDMVRPNIDELCGLCDMLGRIDFVRAKALFAQDVGAQLPHIDSERRIEWYTARHPALMLSLRQQHKEVVPMNIELTPEQRILVISGPNAGGKSVCLKTVGVVQYMMQCGLLPTVRDSSHMCIFNDIMIDIGDQQSIEDDLSTYSSHLQNMKLFLSRGGKKSLLLIDEMGGGTEPQIGGAIAEAILTQLNTLGVMGVVTTHYQNLKHLAENTPGMVNGAMLYDRQRMQPLFQLSIGYPGSSFAIEIARKTGLPQNVIEQASDIVGKDYINMDKYLLDIVRDRRYWEHKRQEIHTKQKKLDRTIEQYNERLEKLTSEQKQILRQAQAEAQQIIKDSNAQVERTIKEIKEAQADKERTRELRRQLDEFKQRLENTEDVTVPSTPLMMPASRMSKPERKKAPKQPSKNKHIDLRPLQAGDNVLLKGSSTVGSVISLDEKYAIVAFGNVKTRVEVTRLERTMRHADKVKMESSAPQGVSESRSRQLEFNQEIDVRGMRADEAIQAVTYFIDDAIQFGIHHVRILHGTGTGALRSAIRLYLGTVPAIRSYHDEHVQLGGAGITVVEL